MKIINLLLAVLLLTACGEDTPVDPVDNPTDNTTTTTPAELPNVKYSSLGNENGKFDLYLRSDGKAELSYELMGAAADSTDLLGTMRGKYVIDAGQYNIAFDEYDALNQLFGTKYVPDSLNVQLVDDHTITFDSARTSIYIYGTICIDEDRYSWATAGRGDGTPSDSVPAH
jgi:hypothetical protein